MVGDERSAVERHAREMATLHERRLVFETMLQDETADPADHIVALRAIAAQDEAVKAIRELILIVMLADNVAALKACVAQFDEEAELTSSSGEHLKALGLSSAANELRQVILDFIELMKGEKPKE